MKTLFSLAFTSVLLFSTLPAVADDQSDADSFTSYAHQHASAQYMVPCAVGMKGSAAANDDESTWKIATAALNKCAQNLNDKGAPDGARSFISKMYEGSCRAMIAKGFAATKACERFQ